LYRVLTVDAFHSREIYPLIIFGAFLSIPRVERAFLGLYYQLFENGDENKLFSVLVLFLIISAAIKKHSAAIKKQQSTP
jgi:hypothetical protein